VSLKLELEIKNIIKHFLSSSIQVPDSEIEAYRMKTLDANFKGAVISIMDELLYFNKLNYKNFHFRVLNEHLITSQSCWAFPKKSFLVDTFNEKLGSFAENGLIDFLTSKFMDKQYLNIKEVKQGPRKINLSQIFGGFEVWFGGLFLAVLLFALEIVAKLFKLSFVETVFESLM
jgi:hypothetical protein